MKRLVPAACVAILTACGAHGGTAGQRTGQPAYVDVHRAFARYGYLQVIHAYDRDIATLAQSERVAAFANMPSQFDTAAGTVRRDTSQAGAHLARLDVRDLSTVRFQSAPVRGVAPQSGAYADALQARAARAHDLREQQLREKEATVALDFERAHAQQQLSLRLRLATHSYLDPALRVRLQRQLAAIQAQEAAAVDAQQRRDAAELEAYDAQLNANDARDLASMNQEVARHRAAMAAIPAPHPQALPASIAHPSFDRTAESQTFSAAGARIAGRFGELRAMDAGARNDANAEIERLKNARNALYQQALRAVRQRAERVAAADRLGTVFLHDAPAGARDITGEL